MEVEIHIRSGIPYVMGCSPGIKITIRDYDIEGQNEEDLEEDKFGCPCMIQTHTAMGET